MEEEEAKGEKVVEREGVVFFVDVGFVFWIGVYWFMIE